MPKRNLVIPAMLSAAMLVAAAGCASANLPRTTRPTIEDYTEMAEAMAQSLAASDLLRHRTPQSEPWVFAIRKVENLSNEVMTESERWYVMARLQSSLPIQAMQQQKNIRFVIPAERRDQLRRYPELDMDPLIAADRRPTHVINAVFYSVPRAVRRDRTDLYYCEFELLPMGDAVPVWVDRFEYKRVAYGHIWD
jgi:hypothetical protein